VTRLNKSLFIAWLVAAMTTAAGAQIVVPNAPPEFGTVTAKYFTPQNGPQPQVKQPDSGTPGYQTNESERRATEALKKDWVTKVFEIKNANDSQISSLRNSLGILPADIGYAGGRFFTVRAPREIMPAIEEAINRLDVLSVTKAAELTAFLLMASNDAAASSTIPPALQPVVNQLKSVLTYKNFQLIDTLIARGTDGRIVELRGVIMIPGAPASTGYSMQGSLHINSSDEKNPILQINNLNFSMQVAEQSTPGTAGYNYRELKISTNVDVPAGKQVVVGKATFNDKAFILVLSAKFE
jgi:hypothetical protein